MIRLSILLLLSNVCFAQDAPDNDIALANLVKHGGQWHISNLKPIANDLGYENQPSFSADSSTIYFTKMDPAGATDIWSYSIITGKTKQLSHSKESEFSPTSIGEHKFSTVRIEADQTQRLWQFQPPDQFSIIFPAVKQVGYTAWVDPQTVALYRLGEPNSIELARLKTHGLRVIAHHTGRCLQKTPSENAVSFVQHIDHKPSQIVSYNIDSRKTRRLAPTINNHEDFAWHPEGTLFQADNLNIFSFTPNSDKKWQPLSGLKPVNLKNISRLAISHDGKLITIVYEKTP
ncbi:MAG: TolB family protein [bacterium]